LSILYVFVFYSFRNRKCYAAKKIKLNSDVN